MSSTSRRSGGPGIDPGTLVLWAVLLVVLVALGAVTAAVHPPPYQTGRSSADGRRATE